MKEHGAILIDGIQKGTTQKCPHCQMHFLVASTKDLDLGKAAAGNLAKPRVWCSKCGRLTCGRRCCDPILFGCIPYEISLEYTEGKMDARFIELIRKRGWSF